ncbi:MAG: YbbR-like domain-containing protein [Bacteroidales bacterium]|nr:YbbR-like domain-containing protein [Bacteroidales bacterium]
MTDELDRIKQKVERTNKHSAFTFLIFLALSTAAWFLVKLSEDYVTQTTFRVLMEEVPADKWVSSDEQSVKMSLNIDGFHTLRYKMIREPNRFVTIPLNEVPYRLENGNTYSFSSQYVAEKVADRLGITASDITMNDAKVYFTMDALKSKVVPVVLQSNITTARQYDVYGIPMLDPSSVTVFGPQEVMDSIKMVRTELLSRDNVNQSFSATLPLDLLDGQIHSNIKEVKVEVQVEKYTEMDVEVPIKVADSLKVRFFPETMAVKCLVAMRDYASITPESFMVSVDKEQLKAMQPLLDVRLATWPPTVQILSTHPDKVEYLIVQ